jgi:uncharacterized protein YchJ
VNAENAMPATDIGRNASCPCGSGRKYKHCCLAKDEEAARKARAAAAARTPAPDEGETAVVKTPKHTTAQPWKRAAINTHGYQRTRMPRKVGGS